MFRLIWQELKHRRKAIFWWSIGLSLFPLIYISVWPQVADMMNSFSGLEVYKVIGVSLESFGDLIGSILLVFVPLVLSIYAIINGTATLAGEEESGRLELIVTLPIPRWKIVTAKAIALSMATFIILLVVSLVSMGVYYQILDQVESEITPLQMGLTLISTWPLTFAVGMISLCSAAFSPTRRIASILSALVLSVGYFGNNLSGMVSSLEPYDFLFLFSYLDSTGTAFLEGQQIDKLLMLLGIGGVAFLLAILFFHRRKLTVSQWPWQ